MMFMEYGIMEEILKLIFILVNIMLYTTMACCAHLCGDDDVCVVISVGLCCCRSSCFCIACWTSHAAACWNLLAVSVSLHLMIAPGKLTSKLPSSLIHKQVCCTLQLYIVTCVNWSR